MVGLKVKRSMLTVVLKIGCRRRIRAEVTDEVVAIQVRGGDGGPTRKQWAC